MRNGGASFLPDHLPPVSDRGDRWLRPLWVATLVSALLIVVAGTVFLLRDVYENDPAFSRLALNAEVQDDGSITVEAFDEEALGGPVPPGSRILSVNGERVPGDLKTWDLAEILHAANGPQVRLELATREGNTIVRRITPSDAYQAGAERRVGLSRDLRIGTRVGVSLVTCLALIACAVLLYLRRSRDPVALLFSFSFLLFAATVDPPMMLWLALGWGEIYDIPISLAWALLVMGLVTFPDGAFRPTWLRFGLLALPFAIIALSIDETPMALNLLVAFAIPLVALLAVQWGKYRNFPPGIERQQIKWAAFGFASGLVLIAAAVLVAEVIPETDPWVPLWGLVVLALFDLGFLAMALGLFISLTRFRLWEADRVISKSAVSAGVTLLVAVIWTTSMDLVKTAVEWVLGQENVAIATMAGAVLAAGIFTPTQALALRWTKQRLQSNQAQVEKLVARLAAWRSAESPAEIAQRALAALAGATHAGYAAILVDNTRGRTLLASRGLAAPEALEATDWMPEDDPRFPVALTLEDDDGPVGLLLAGPRSDNNRYNADELESFRMVTEPLAEALRTARRRAEENETMQRMLGSVQERLARLEGGGPSPLPT